MGFRAQGSRIRVYDTLRFRGSSSPALGYTSAAAGAPPLPCRSLWLEMLRGLVYLRVLGLRALGLQGVRLEAWML